MKNIMLLIKDFKICEKFKKANQKDIKKLNLSNL